MKRQLLRFAPWVALMVVGVVSTPRPANPEPQPRMHERIRAAMDAMRDAQDYMRRAPHDFCGHKVEAMRANEAAIRQLGMALECRR
ncbi:MAG TPA: hypothetical protein VMA31_17560 [Bryobacteraceae bacterium]|nr:hypothetical protein [Bryobacteraceae bacterium]